MHWLDLATALLGVGMVVLGVLVPSTGMYVIIPGASLIALAVKRPSDLTGRAKDPDDQNP